jgi:phosphoglycolate phosphatase
MHDAVLFDLDGTLIDSLRDIAESMNRTLARLGNPIHPVDAYRTFVGDGVQQLAQRALPPGADDSTIATFLDAYRADYRISWKVHTRPYPGIPALLATLADRGIPMAVLSNKPDAVTRTCVEYFFPDTPFIAVHGQRPDVPRKPDPAAALAIAAAMNRSPASCVFVGDTSTDMDTATAAGMLAAGVTWGFRGEDELIAHGADLIAHEAGALLGLFTPSAS